MSDRPAERGPSGTGHDTAPPGFKSIGRPAAVRRMRSTSASTQVMPDQPPVAVPGPASVSPAEPPEEVAAERDELRRVLYEAAREVPTSDAGVHKHHDLQHLHRRIIAALREEEPDGECVTYDYWIGRYP